MLLQTGKLSKNSTGSWRGRRNRQKERERMLCEVLDQWTAEGTGKKWCGYLRRKKQGLPAQSDLSQQLIGCRKR
jgi:hypothetical protein